MFKERAPGGTVVMPRTPRPHSPDDGEAKTRIAPLSLAARAAFDSEEATVVVQSSALPRRQVYRADEPTVVVHGTPAPRFERNVAEYVRPTEEPTFVKGGAKNDLFRHQRAGKPRNVVSLAIMVGATAFAAVALLLVLLESPASSGLRMSHATLPPPRSAPSDLPAATPSASAAPVATAAVNPGASHAAQPAASGPSGVKPPETAAARAALALATKAAAQVSAPVSAPARADAHGADAHGANKLSLERRAADLVARGERAAAAELYGQLAAANPEQKAYSEALRILKASANADNTVR
jgi:hypothetical protein